MVTEQQAPEQTIAAAPDLTPEEKLQKLMRQLAEERRNDGREIAELRRQLLKAQSAREQETAAAYERGRADGLAVVHCVDCPHCGNILESARGLQPGDGVSCSVCGGSSVVRTREVLWLEPHEPARLEANESEREGGSDVY